MSYESKSIIVVVGVIVLLLGIVVLAGACGSTQTNTQGEFPVGAVIVNLEMLPKVPSLKGLSSDQMVVVLTSYFETCKAVAASEGGHLPGALTLTFENILNQLQTGTVSPTTSTTAELQATLQEAFKGL